MAKDPAFLFYSSDFLTGIAGLDMEERGQYITLLCLQHQKGPLNEKTIRLAVGLVSVCVLSKFSKNEKGEYFNPRLSEEIEKRRAFTESRVRNGKLGGRGKSKKASANLQDISSLTYEEPKKNLPDNANEDDKLSINMSAPKKTFTKGPF